MNGISFFNMEAKDRGNLHVEVFAYNHIFALVGILFAYSVAHKVLESRMSLILHSP